jgi:MFS superfamily sulfate permease-like transporter
MQKKPKHGLRIYLLYGAFGIAVTFAVTILLFWIFEEIVDPIPMSILIGLLVGLAFKLFADALHREEEGK